MHIHPLSQAQPASEPLESLLDRLTPKLERIVAKYGIPTQDAEDLIQQTLLAFVHKRASIRCPEVWLVGALKKQCLLYLRTHRRRLYDALDAAVLELLAEPATPAQESRDVARDVGRAIARIPERCQSLLGLRYGMGYDNSEVAERLGYRESSIRKITTRCLAALTKQIVGPGYRRENPNV